MEGAEEALGWLEDVGVWAAMGRNGVDKMGCGAEESAGLGVEISASKPVARANASKSAVDMLLVFSPVDFSKTTQTICIRYPGSQYTRIRKNNEEFFHSSGEEEETRT
jgi:hypothetical protein